VFARKLEKHKTKQNIEQQQQQQQQLLQQQQQLLQQQHHLHQLHLRSQQQADAADSTLQPPTARAATLWSVAPNSLAVFVKPVRLKSNMCLSGPYFTRCFGRNYCMEK
jgi:transcription initiation factor TFIID subunit TAF12